MISIRRVTDHLVTDPRAFEDSKVHDEVRVRLDGRLLRLKLAVNDDLSKRLPWNPRLR